MMKATITPPMVEAMPESIIDPDTEEQHKKPRTKDTLRPINHPESDDAQCDQKGRKCTPWE